MDDKLIIAIVAAAAAVVGGLVQAVTAYLLSRRNNRGSETEIALDYFVAQLERLETIKYKTFQLRRQPDVLITKQSDVAGKIAAGAIASVKHVENVLGEYGHMFPHEMTERLSADLGRIHACKSQTYDEIRSKDVDPIDLSFKVMDHLSSGIDSALRDLQDRCNILIRKIS